MSGCDPIKNVITLESAVCNSGRCTQSYVNSQIFVRDDLFVPEQSVIKSRSYVFKSNLCEALRFPECLITVFVGSRSRNETHVISGLSIGRVSSQTQRFVVFTVTPESILQQSAAVGTRGRDLYSVM